MKRSWLSVPLFVACASVALAAQSVRNVPRITIDELKPLILHFVLI